MTESWLPWMCLWEAVFGEALLHSGNRLSPKLLNCEILVTITLKSNLQLCEELFDRTGKDQEEELSFSVEVRIIL